MNTQLTRQLSKNLLSPQATCSIGTLCLKNLLYGTWKGSFQRHIEKLKLTQRDPNFTIKPISVYRILTRRRSCYLN